MDTLVWPILASTFLFWVASFPKYPPTRQVLCGCLLSLPTKSSLSFASQNAYVNINRIMSVASRLSEAGHYASQQIKQISTQLDQEWKSFAAALDERSTILAMSAVFHQKAEQVRPRELCVPLAGRAEAGTGQGESTYTVCVGSPPLFETLKTLLSSCKDNPSSLHKETLVTLGSLLNTQTRRNPELVHILF